MALLRTLLIILTFYYLFKIISRYVLPFLLKRFVSTMQNKAQQQTKQQQESKAKVGETVIDEKPTKDNQSNNSVGEYVDYEEID
jgi:hypothetical protein